MFSFTLPNEFVENYRNREVFWGYRDAAGNALGELTFIRTYSRVKDDGGKERWYEVCERVINGMYSIQKDHAKQNRLPWNDNKAQKSAQEAYERLFTFKWNPPGRGLWMMGTPLVHEHKNSSALQNCSAVSTSSMTKNDPAAPFRFLMEASMLGVGVGFDGKGADKNFTIYRPSESKTPYVVPDTREGWAESTSELLNSYLKPNQGDLIFDYSQVRPEGSPIKTFGGTAAGPEPLKLLHERLRRLFNVREGTTLTTTDIADIGNLIGVCVVSGNVRRSALLLQGSIDDNDFLNLKNADMFPERNSYDPQNPGWAWMANHSVTVNVDTDLTKIVEGIKHNGEPGVIWLDTTRNYGRLIDPPDYKDHRVTNYNPCAEQPLESYEMCNLVDVSLSRHDNKEDFLRTLKFAYLYAKTVTLMPTHWPETNTIMQRNRRIGTSLSGTANFADAHGLVSLREWMDEGYQTIRRYDHTYSEWMCVRESIRVTTSKPAGTTSILTGDSPGIHWATGGKYFLRRIRFAKNNLIVKLCAEAGYLVEPASEDPENTVVIAFPIKSKAKRSDKEVSLYEKANLAVLAQRYWSDNAVSVTLSFDKETESDAVENILQMHAGDLKTASFLPMGNDTYPQMPYSSYPQSEYEMDKVTLKKIDFSMLYDGGVEIADAEGEKYCSTDACEVQTITINADNEQREVSTPVLNTNLIVFEPHS